MNQEQALAEELASKLDNYELLQLVEILEDNDSVLAKEIIKIAVNRGIIYNV
jgi:hypothetical protein